MIARSEVARIFDNLPNEQYELFAFFFLGDFHPFGDLALGLWQKTFLSPH